MTKSCNDCVYVTHKEIYDAHRIVVCDYPIPAWLTIRVSGGNFLSGHEAESCSLYTSKLSLKKLSLGETK